MQAPEDERIRRMISLRETVVSAWQAAMLKRLGQEAPDLAERIAMQVIPRPAELSLKRAALHDERARLEQRLREIEAQTAQDEEQQRSILFSLSTFRQHLSITNKMLGELVEQEPGSLRRASLESQRSEGCACVGVGGTGRITSIIAGVPMMETVCPVCPEGAALAARMAEVDARCDRQETAEREARAAAHAAEKTQEILERAGIPDIYATSTFETILALPITVTEDFQDWVEEAASRYGDLTGAPYPHGFFLWGPAGHGKTSLMAAIGHACARAGIPVMFTSVLTLLDTMRAGYGRRDGSSDALLVRAKTVPVLLLDDLGMQQGTDHERARILAIISDRHGQGNRLLTCFTSNYTINRAAEMIAGGPSAYKEEVARIEGRLREMADEVMFENLDLRALAHRQPVEHHPVRALSAKEEH
jgi:DNA replication protein DnaC